MNWMTLEADGSALSRLIVFPTISSSCASEALVSVAAPNAVNGYPTKCIIDPEGKIVRIFSGESAEFYTYLDDLLK